MTPGEYPSLSMEAYQSSEPISKSGICAAAIAPSVFHETRMLQRGGIDTAAFKLGRLFHLHMDGSIAEVAVKGPAVKSRSDAKWKAFEQENPGRICLKPDEWENLQAMAKATRSFPAAKLYLVRPGRYEVSYVWQDELTDLLCKCRPDFLTDNCRFVIDFKTTTDPGLWAFRESAYRYHYYVSAAHTLNGIEACTGIRPEKYIYIAQQSVAPYLTGVYYATDDEIKLGEALIREMLETIRQCKATGIWPGLPDEVQPLGLPYRGYQELRKIKGEENKLERLIS